MPPKWKQSSKDNLGSIRAQRRSTIHSPTFNPAQLLGIPGFYKKSPKRKNSENNTNKDESLSVSNLAKIVLKIYQNIRA